MSTELQKEVHVSVIVPHYNDLEALDRCLSALAAQSFSVKEMEIIVADNMSLPGLEAVEKIVAKRAVLVQVAHRGAGPARNGGVAASTGTILAFLDSDCIPHAEWIVEGVAGLAKFDIVGGSVEVLVRDPAQMTAIEAFESVFAFKIEDYVSRKGFVITGNLFCKRDVFDSVGKFGVGISEDVDWCHRATVKGFSIGYAPGAVVGHLARYTWPELRKKWLRIDAETYSLRVRRNSDRLTWALFSLLLPVSAFLHTPRVLLATRLSWPQKMAALSILYRLRFWRAGDYLRLLLGKALQ